MNNIVRWEPVKEARGDYFVEYCPASDALYLAALSLIFLKTPDVDKIISVMEAELRTWLQRYPVPVMVSSFDSRGDVIDLQGHKPCNHLTGFVALDSHEIVSRWALGKDDYVPSQLKSREHRLAAYAGLPHKTEADVRKSLDARRRIVRVGWFLVFFWSVVIPAVLAFVGWASPLISVCVMVYALSKAVIQALKLTGKWPRSRPDEQRQREDLDMRHHHYHCKRNPEGFARLRAENFCRDEEERTQKEFSDLQTAQNRQESAR